MEELPEHSEASAGLLLEWMKNRMTQDGETVLQNLFQTGTSCLDWKSQRKTLCKWLSPFT